MRAAKYRDRLLDAEEHEIVPFPGALRPRSDLAEALADQRAWSVIREIRRKNLAEQQRRMLILRMVSAYVSIKNAFMWALRKVGVSTR
jgi:hypothetical protein